MGCHTKAELLDCLYRGSLKRGSTVFLKLHISLCNKTAWSSLYKMSSVWRIQTTYTLGKNTVWSSLHKMSSVSRIWTKYTLGKNTMIISLQNEFCVKNSNAQNTRVQTQKHNQSLYTLHISETSVNVIICSYLRLFGISSASPSQQFLSFRMIWTANPLSVLCCYMRPSHYNSLHPLPTYPNYFLHFAVVWDLQTQHNSLFATSDRVVSAQNSPSYLWFSNASNANSSQDR